MASTTLTTTTTTTVANRRANAAPCSPDFDHLAMLSTDMVDRVEMLSKERIALHTQEGILLFTSDGSQCYPLRKGRTIPPVRASNDQPVIHSNIISFKAGAFRAPGNIEECIPVGTLNNRTITILRCMNSKLQTLWYLLMLNNTTNRVTNHGCLITPVSFWRTTVKILKGEKNIWCDRLRGKIAPILIGEYLYIITDDGEGRILRIHLSSQMAISCPLNTPFFGSNSYRHPVKLLDCESHLVCVYKNAIRTLPLHHNSGIRDIRLKKVSPNSSDLIWDAVSLPLRRFALMREDHREILVYSCDTHSLQSSIDLTQFRVLPTGAVPSLLKVSDDVFLSNNSRGVHLWRARHPVDFFSLADSCFAPNQLFSNEKTEPLHSLRSPANSQAVSHAQLPAADEGSHEYVLRFFEEHQRQLIAIVNKQRALEVRESAADRFLNDSSQAVGEYYITLRTRLQDTLAAMRLIDTGFLEDISPTKLSSAGSATATAAHVTETTHISVVAPTVEGFKLIQNDALHTLTDGLHKANIPIPFAGVGLLIVARSIKFSQDRKRRKKISGIRNLQKLMPDLSDLGTFADMVALNATRIQLAYLRKLPPGHDPRLLEALRTTWEHFAVRDRPSPAACLALSHIELIVQYFVDNGTKLTRDNLVDAALSVFNP